MDRIGVRELRQNASQFLSRVMRGESFEVTDRGRPVAHLVPIGEDTAWQRLKASGKLREAETDLPELLPPIRLPKGARLLSEILEDMRKSER